MTRLKAISSLLIALACASGCSPGTSGEWKETKANTPQSRLERAKAICNGRAAETQIAAGRLWIAGAVASNSSFQACMAERGFTQG